MNILRLKNSNVVIALNPALLDETHAVLSGGIHSYALTTDNAEIVAASKPPFPFVPKAYTYDGNWVVVDADAVARKRKAFAIEAAKRKAVEITAQYDKGVKQITEGYDDYEIASWPQQADEAKARDADAQAPVPFVEALATARGVTVNYLVTRILQKEAAFKGLYGAILGRKQKRTLELQAVDMNDPDAITHIQAV